MLREWWCFTENSSNSVKTFSAIRFRNRRNGITFVSPNVFNQNLITGKWWRHAAWVAVGIIMFTLLIVSLNSTQVKRIKYQTRWCSLTPSYYVHNTVQQNAAQQRTSVVGTRPWHGRECFPNSFCSKYIFRTHNNNTRVQVLRSLCVPTITIRKYRSWAHIFLLCGF